MKMTERTPPITRTFTIEVNEDESSILLVALEKLIINHNDLTFISQARQMLSIISDCRYPSYSHTIKK